MSVERSASLERARCGSASGRTNALALRWLLTSAVCWGVAAQAWPASVAPPLLLLGAVVVGPEVAIEPVAATDAGAAAPGQQWVPAIASDGTGALVVWEDYRGSPDPDIVGSRLSALGEVLDPAGIVIAVGTAAHRSPAVVFDGVNYLVVWAEQRGADYGIFGARVTSAGAVLDVPGFVIDDSPGDQLSPAVASSGAVSLVAWHGANGAFRDIWAVRVVSGGTAPVEASPTELCGASGLQERAATSFGGGIFLVSWTDERRGAGLRDVYAARVDPLTGAVLDSNGFPITTSGSVEIPSVTASQAEFLVGWSDERQGWQRRHDIIVARVGFDGGVVDPEGVNVVSEDGMDKLRSVGFDGTSFLLNSYLTRVGAGEPFEAVTRRLTRALQIVAPGKIALWGQDPGYTHYTPRVAMVGTSAFFVWERSEMDTGATDVFLSRLPDGAGAIAAPPALASAQPWSQDVGAVTGSGSGWTVVWSDGRTGTPTLRARSFGPALAALGSSLPVTAPPGPDGGFSATAVAPSDGGLLVLWSQAIDAGAGLFSSLELRRPGQRRRDGGTPRRGRERLRRPHGRAAGP